VVSLSQFMCSQIINTRLCLGSGTWLVGKEWIDEVCCYKAES
jgi:hypothetical protein